MEYVALNSWMICNDYWKSIVIICVAMPRSLVCGYDIADGRTKDTVHIFTVGSFLDCDWPVPFLLDLLQTLFSKTATQNRNPHRSRV